MNNQLRKLLYTAATTTLLATACTTEVADPDPDPSTGITQQATTSECGGFARLTDSGSSGQEPAYCEAEVLHWSYDAEREALSVTDSRIELNCCGDHDIQIEQVGDRYVITETDAPEDMGAMGLARCDCMCVFDFALDAEGIPEEAIELAVVRNVTDGGGTTTIFEGSVDLTAGSGFVVVDETPSMWCEYDSVSDDAPSAS